MGHTDLDSGHSAGEAEVVVSQARMVRDAAEIRHLPPGVGRVYLGAECCDRLLPTPDLLTDASRSAGRLPVTLVLPFLTQRTLGRARELLQHASRCGVDEVVANDLGALEMAAEAGFAGRLSAGRLLNHQRRGPRLQRMLQKMPPSALASLQRPPLDAPAWRELFDDLGVCRVELDLPPAGLRRRDPAALPGSLWWPHVLVAVSRFCVAALAEDLAARQPGRVWPCQRSCRQTLVALRHPAMPGPLWSRGPAQHWENPGELPDLRALSVDRVVELPEVPF